MKFVCPREPFPVLAPWKSALHAALPLTCALMLPGCASIVSGQHQVVSVETPGCPAARCELSNDKGKWYVASTPGTTTVDRSYNNMQVLCSKERAADSTGSFASKTKGMAFGNILFGGLIGAGVDVANGSAYDYPQTLSVPMRCDGTAGSDAAAAQEQTPRLGLQLAQVEPSAMPGSEPGVRIVAVVPGSLAAQAGIQPGEFVLKVNGASVSNPDDLARLVEAAREPSAIELLILNAAGDSQRRVQLSSVQSSQK